MKNGTTSKQVADMTGLAIRTVNEWALLNGVRKEGRAYAWTKTQIGRLERQAAKQPKPKAAAKPAAGKRSVCLKREPNC